jgi:hypothetical protein
MRHRWRLSPARFSTAVRWGAVGLVVAILWSGSPANAQPSPGILAFSLNRPV